MGKAKKSTKILVAIILILISIAIGLIATIVVNYDLEYIIANAARYEESNASTSEDGKFEYEVLTDGTIEISEYIGTDIKVTIPNSIDGISVTSIGYEAFKDCRLLISIELPEGLKKIDRKAFENCVSLTSITIPDSVTMVGQEDTYIYGKLEEYQFDVFRGCINLESIIVGDNNANYSSAEGVLFDKNKTKLISYPEGKKDSEYTIPLTVTKVGAYSIYNVRNVSKINVHDDLLSMGDGAFRGCANLLSVSIPAALETINNDVFDECVRLKSITVDEGNLNYSSNNGVLFNKDKTVLLFYPIGKEDTEYIIPSTVTTIGAGAFLECTNLTNIQIPNSVINIEWYAFYGCTGLTEVTIPDSVKKMGTVVYGFTFNNIFENCTNLVKVTLPENVEEIYLEEMFSGCRKLETVNLPNNITYIGDSMFLDCTNIKNITIPDSVTYIESRAFQNCSNLTEITLPDGVEGMGSSVFYQTNITNVEIASGVETILSGVFEKCRNLININIPDTVTNVSRGAFREALLTINMQTTSDESYEIELPEIIKRAKNEEDILYSSSGFYLKNCSWNETKDKIIVKKEHIENGTAKLTVQSGALEYLEIMFVSETFQDTTAPEIDQISIADGGKVWRTGEKITIDVHFSEFIKGNPPILKLKFGEGTEGTAVIPNNEWGSGPDLRYYYTVQAGDNGVLDIISFSGGETTDWSENALVEIDDFSNKQDIIYYPYGVIFANTNIINPEDICEEYHITNKEELLNIKELVNSGTFDFIDSTVYLENDIDLGGYYDENLEEWTGETWEPIGKSYNPFKGTFEGNGHKITGLYINSEEDYQGFIGYNSGTIKNLGIENGYIYSTGNYVGGISGINYNIAIIENCYNKANIVGKYAVGGISGSNNNPYSGEIRIVNCYNSGIIIGKSSIRRSFREHMVK